MGQARPTVGHIRSFMTSLSMRLYELIQAALEGSYHTVDAEFFADDGVSRLRARVQEMNTNFSDYMRDHGQRRKVGSHARSSKSDHGLIDETAELIVSKAEMMQWVKEVCLFDVPEVRGCNACE